MYTASLPTLTIVCSRVVDRQAERVRLWELMDLLLGSRLISEEVLVDLPQCELRLRGCE